MLPQVWVHATGYLAEAILAGLVRVRAKGTAASCGAMSADLAEVLIVLCFASQLHNHHAATWHTYGARISMHCVLTKQVSAVLRAAAPKDAVTTGALEGQLRLVDSWIRVRGATMNCEGSL